MKTYHDSPPIPHEMPSGRRSMTYWSVSRMNKNNTFAHRASPGGDTALPVRSSSPRLRLTMVDAETDRFSDMALGSLVADALVISVHWNYECNALLRDFGLVRAYPAPQNLYEDGILRKLIPYGLAVLATT